MNCYAATTRFNRPIPPEGEGDAWIDDLFDYYDALCNYLVRVTVIEDAEVKLRWFDEQPIERTYKMASVRGCPEEEDLVIVETPTETYVTDYMGVDVLIDGTWMQYNLACAKLMASTIGRDIKNAYDRWTRLRVAYDLDHGYVTTTHPTDNDKYPGIIAEVVAQLEVRA